MMTCVHGVSIAPGPLDLAKAKEGIWHVSSTNHGGTKTLTTSSKEWRPQFVFFDRSNDHLIKVDDDLEVYRLLEETFESVRASISPALPSRRFAFYGFPCRQCATDFKGSRGRAKSLTYSVGTKHFRGGFVGDMRLRNMSANVIRLSEKERIRRGYSEDPAMAVASLASCYWTGKPHPRATEYKPIPEALLLGDVRLRAIAEG